ncbi:hypothetical protein [Kordiimonas sp.]|uniref:tetratricopeptide repeat protein n=1 Tax=Kordiimonas sp. TaxID=1970157 RepID=UPI003B525C39
MGQADEVHSGLDSRELTVRVDANLRDAEHWQAAGDLDLAEVCLRRAFELTGHSAEISERLASLLTQNNKLEDAREVLQAGLHQAVQSGDLDLIVQCYRRWQYYTTQSVGVEDYRFDFLALAGMERAVADLKAQLTITSMAQQGEVNPLQPKVLYVGTNLAQVGSVLAKVLLSMIDAHDTSKFEFGLVFTDDEKKLYNTEETAALIHLAEAKGWMLFLEPDLTVTGRVTKLARRLHDWRPDLLVTNCALASAEGLLLSASLPNILRCSLVVGPPPLFAAPNSDFVVASDERLLMECPVDGVVVPVETTLPDRDDVQPAYRSEIDIPATARIVVAAGRYTKFSAQYCDTLAKILSGNERIFLLTLGIPKNEEENFLARFPNQVASRIRIVPWGRNYLGHLILGDLLIDTFPSGGGITVQDAMALEIPSICVGDDVRRPYKSDQWSVAYKFALPELVVAPGKEEGIVSLALAYMSDTIDSASLKERCRSHVAALRGDPVRMTKLHEEVYSMLLEQR